MAERSQCPSKHSQSSANTNHNITSAACPPSAQCHAIIEDFTKQFSDQGCRHEEECRSRLQIQQNYEKLSQQNMDLNQQINAKSEACRKGDAAYRDLEKAYKHVQSRLGLAHQERQCLQYRLDQERTSVQQANARLDDLLHTTRMVTQTFYFSTIDKSDLSDEKKRQEKKLDYAAVYIERDLLQMECDELKECLAKERGEKFSRGLGPVQMKQEHWT